jgi:hypothetical protein
MLGALPLLPHTPSWLGAYYYATRITLLVDLTISSENFSAKFPCTNYRAITSEVICHSFVAQLRKLYQLTSRTNISDF